jgi:hypothetical protein
MYRDPEATYQDADIEQAELEAAGREVSRGHKRMMALRQSSPMAAARACKHGWGYPTDSPAAENSKDPRAGQKGERCLNCGSWWAGRVSFRDMRDTDPTVPCELPPAR